MEDGRIADRQITASSYTGNHFPYFARLHNKTSRLKNIWGAWCSNDDDPNRYLQVRVLYNIKIRVCLICRDLFVLQTGVGYWYL